MAREDPSRPSVDTDDAQAIVATGTNEQPAAMTVSQPREARHFNPKASLIICGFRGVGKSTLALVIATHLGRSFIDCDRALSKYAGCTPNEYIDQHSWEGFRDLETQILRKILEQCSEGFVIACGGGVVEREENREMLIEYGLNGGPVIHLTREKENVISYLINEKTRPQWGEEIRSVWSKRFPLYEQCSTHTYYSLTARRDPLAPSLALKHVERDFTRFVKRILQPLVDPLPQHPRRTYIITLNGLDPTLLDKARLETATSGGAAIELRVDTLQAPRPLGSPFSSPQSTPASNPGAPDLTHIAFALAQLRKLSELPIIFTLRTVRQDGRFVLDEASEPTYVHLILSAFKLGVEFVDLELDLGPELLRRLINQKPPSTSIILSHVERSRTLDWAHDDVCSLYHHCVMLGADVVKLTLPGTNSSHLESLRTFRHRFDQQQLSQSGFPTVPFITLNEGQGGDTSAIYNYLFTPVTHPILRPHLTALLPTFVACQRQLSAAHASPRRQIAIDPYTNTRAVEGFRAGIAQLNLPYILVDATNMSSSFEPVGGLLAVDLAKERMDTALLSPESSWIGYCDTKTMAPGQPRFCNSRSIAMAEAIQRNLAPINAITSVSVAVILGARGRAGREAVSALLQAGLQHIYCVQSDTTIKHDNHSVHHSETLALPPKHVPTLIVSCDAVDLPEQATADLFASPTGGTLLDLVSTSSHPIWAEQVAMSGLANAWVVLGPANIEAATLKLQFRLITGYRLPPACSSL